MADAGFLAWTFGFSGNRGDIARFGARYRVAKAFRGLTLDGFNKGTVAGYSAMMGVFLAWSAFERYLALISKNQDGVLADFAPYDPAGFIANVATADVGHKFYLFVHPRVNTPHQAKLTEFKNGTLQNPTYLASAVRHLFGHGHLAAHSGTQDPAHAKKICDLIFDYHMKFLDSEFSKAVANTKATFKV